MLLDADAILRTASTAILFVVLIVATFTDIVHHRIYNWCTLPAILMGLALAFLRPGGAAFLASLEGFALGFGVFFVAWWVGGFGAADMKLMGAVGALGGYPFVVTALVWTAACGALMAVAALVRRGRLFPGLRRAVAMMLSLAHRWRVPEPAPGAGEDPAQQVIPYGLAIACGTFIAFFVTRLGEGA